MVQPGACRRVASGSGGSGGSSGARVGGARATPQGRDKSSVKKSKGRWMLQEHQQFIIGLGQFGRDWKAIGDIVRTRTAVQIRTHAQKYFQQMEKGRCFPEEPYKSIDDECTPDSRAAERSSSSSSSGPNSTPSSALEHGGAGTTKRPHQKPSLSSSSSSSSSLLGSSASSSSLSSAPPALTAPTAALLAPQFQARVNAGGARHHPTRRAILTTPAGERGKRLTRPTGASTVAAVPRATRASSAAAAAAIVAATSASAAAAAAATAAATDGNGTDDATAAESDGPFEGVGGDDGDDHRLRAKGRGGGEGGGGDGDEVRGKDGKRRKLDRPPSADIVSAGTAAESEDVGGMGEAMEAAGGSMFAVSPPGWLDQRFRGKRGLVSGNSGGLDLAGMGAGSGGFARVGLQVDVDLAGMYSDPPIVLSPTFKKADGGSPPWSMIGNMEEGEAGAAAMVSGAGVLGLVGWRSDVGSPSRHKSPLFSDTFLEDFLVGGGAKDSAESSDDDPPPPPSPPLPPPSLCASSSSISCSSSISSNSSSSLCSSISSSSSSVPPSQASSSCRAAGRREVGSKPYMPGSFAATAAAGAVGTTATKAETPGNIFPSSVLTGATGDQQRPTSQAAVATPTSCEGFGYGFAVGPDDCVARDDTDGGFSLDSMSIPLSSAHHEMAGNGILGGSSGPSFPQKQDAPWDASTAGGDGRGGGYTGGDFDDHAVFAAIHGGGRSGAGGGVGASGPSSKTGAGTGSDASAGNTGMNLSRQIDFLPFQHQQQSAPSHAGSMLGRAKGATAAAVALSLSEQQAAAVAAAVHDCFATSVGGGARETAVLQTSLGGRGSIEDGPLCGNWLSYEDVGDGIGAGQDGLGMDADDAAALNTLFAFEDHFGML